ncbi:MAG: restriction endonuclease [Acetobacterales bacterium]
MKYVSIAAPPKPATQFLVEICLRENWFDSDDEAHEAAERWLERFLSELQDEANRLRSLGRFVFFDFNSSSTSYLQGPAFVEPSDDAYLTRHKQQISRVANYHSHLADLTPGEFEKLCAGVLRLLGVQNPECTQMSNDQGIDFFGRLAIGSALVPEQIRPNFEAQMYVWLVGQAKHYQRASVSTSAIRELVGSVELARGRAYSTGGSIFSGLHIRISDPVYCLFFCTGTLSAGIWRLLENSGVIGMDGNMVAAFLATNDVGVSQGVFDRVLFSRWLDQN